MTATGARGALSKGFLVAQEPTDPEDLAAGGRVLVDTIVVGATRGWRSPAIDALGRRATVIVQRPSATVGVGNDVAAAMLVGGWLSVQSGDLTPGPYSGSTAIWLARATGLPVVCGGRPTSALIQETVTVGGVERVLWGAELARGDMLIVDGCGPRLVRGCSDTRR